MIKGQAEKFFNDLSNGRYKNLNLATTEQVRLWPTQQISFLGDK